MLQIHPVHRVFLNFYAAISYELLGQAAHLYSSTKISLLNAALDCFVECGAALPEPLPLPKLSKVEITPLHLSPLLQYPSTPRTRSRNLISFDAGLFLSPEHDSLVRSITKLIDISLSDMEEDPFMSDNEKGLQTQFMLSMSPLKRKPATKAEKDRLFRVMISPTKTPAAEIKESTKKNNLMPSPLRVRKIPEELGPSLAKPRSSDSSSSQRKSSTRPRPPPLPLRIIPATQINITAQKGNRNGSLSSKHSPSHKEKPIVHTPKKITDPEESMEIMTPIRAAKIVQYNRGIELLRSQITFNINSLQQHVDHVLDIQRYRRSRKMQRSISFWSFDPIKLDDEVNVGKDKEPVLDQFGNALAKETKAQRITRLRSEGWRTVGLRSPQSTWKGARYYQEFCSMVLNEMYLDQ